MGSATPDPKRARSQRSPILGFLSIYAYTRYYSSIKLDVVTHTGSRGGLVLWGQPHPTLKGRCPSAAQFWSSLL